MLCELCNLGEARYKILVEGAELAACERCKSSGKVTKTLRAELPKKKKTKEQTKPQPAPKKEFIESVVEDFSRRIRKARERLGMTQRDFARKISEKESVVHKLETGAIEPSIVLARKLERLLKIKLVEQREEEAEIKEQDKKEASDKFTIGDIIKND